MPYPRNKIVADTDRHVNVTTNLNLANERQWLQANKRRNQAPRCKIGQKVMLSSQNINLRNVNKKMKPTWLGLFPITQVNYQLNNYTHDLSSNCDLRHIDKTFHIGLVKPYRENNQHEFPQPYYNQLGPVTDDRYEVKKAVNFRFSQIAREPLYAIRWKGYLTSQDQ